MPNRKTAIEDTKEFFERTYNDNSIRVFLDEKGNVQDVELTDEAYNRAEALAQRFAEEAVERNAEAQKEFSAIRQAVAKRSLYLSPQDRGDITDFAAYNARGNRVRLTSNPRATSVDSVYQELAGRFPHRFSTEVTHPAEQVMRINDVLDYLRGQSAVRVADARGRSGMEELQGEITARLLDGYMRARVNAAKAKRRGQK